MITFQDGSTLALTAINAAGSVSACAQASANGFLCGDVMNVTTATQSVYRKRGQTFTCTSGCSGATQWNTRSFLLLPENLNLSTPFNNSLFYREIPQLSTTGGTANIVPDDNFHMGFSGVIPVGGPASGTTNPSWAFGTVMECLINRCAGDRVYQIRPYASGYSDQVGIMSNVGRAQATTFGGTGLAAGQVNMNEHFENGPTVGVFKGISYAETAWTRYQKYILQPAINSPDTGQPWIDCSARGGSYGDIAICWNASDGPQSANFSLTPYLQAGQKIIRFVVNDHSMSSTTLNAGTSADSLTLQPADAVFYVFPVAFDSELFQPAISARLADVASATKIVVRFAYDRYYLDSINTNAFDCGSGTCTPNWDRNVGTVYYRLIYLGANSAVLATSDVQTL